MELCSGGGPSCSAGAAKWHLWDCSHQRPCCCDGLSFTMRGQCTFPCGHGCVRARECIWLGARTRGGPHGWWSCKYRRLHRSYGAGCCSCRLCWRGWWDQRLGGHAQPQCRCRPCGHDGSSGSSSTHRAGDQPNHGAAVRQPVGGVPACHPSPAAAHPLCGTAHGMGPCQQARAPTGSALPISPGRDGVSHCPGQVCVSSSGSLLCRAGFGRRVLQRWPARQ